MTSVIDPPQKNEFDGRGFSLEDRYTREEGTVFLTGISALARMVRDRAALDRRLGLRTASLISGYEGSPLAGYDLEIAGKAKRFLDPYDVVHRPALNEEIGATSVMGSQLAAPKAPLDGVVGYWYGKAPGLDRAADALRHANLIGTNHRGGAVALVGDDPGAKSSTVPCASEMALADLYMPILYPSDSQDILDMGIHAALMSRTSGLWTSLKISAHVADGSSTAEVSPDRITPVLEPLGDSPHIPSGRLLGKSLMELEQNQLTTRIPRALEYARLNGINKMVTYTGDDRIGIVAAGKTYLDVRSAMLRMGIDEDEMNRRGIRLLKLGMVYPMERDMLFRFVEGLDEVIVVEEKRDFIETMIREILYDHPRTPNVRGKSNEDGSTLFSRFGELDIDSVTTGLAHRLGTVHGIEAAQRWVERESNKRTRINLPLAQRTPYFCSGCPHNSSTKVSDDSLVGAGIGCHAMVLLQPEKQVGNVIGVTQMGGEGAQWIGMAPFVKEKHFVQNLGDGTFDHSGSLAVRAAVAAGVNITYKLLFNGTVAMTGGQDPVGGKTLVETLHLLKAEKVGRIVVTTDNVAQTKKLGLPSGIEVRHRRDLADVQRELAATPGVTVLVHDQHCAAEKRRKRKRGAFPTPNQRVVINERICEGCGDCGEKSNCLSVHPVDTEFGRKTRIDQSTCNLDFSCLEGDCPSFMTVSIPEAGERKQGLNIVKKVNAPELSDQDLPTPTNPISLDDAGGFGMRITGIGGTGVVTVSAVLATAAVIDGSYSRTLDMTGLAQKGGAVVSDVKISARPTPQAAKIGKGEADLYLCADGLVGADSTNLKAASTDRTTAVLSTTKVPTGQMVTDTKTTYPQADEISGRIAESTRRLVQLDPIALSEELFGDSSAANMVLVGAAYQAGALPISAEAIEKAIDLNGVAVDRNIQSFRRGRQTIADPQSLEKTLVSLRPAPKPAPTQTLPEIIDLRIAELTEYQDAEYARRYAERVDAVRRAEATIAPGSTMLAESVARYLHKLMAYKDEYEVARLATDPSVAADIAADFGPDAKMSIRLHPPMLRAMGMKNKMTLGPWAQPVLKTLSKGKKLRGTRFDVFGKTHERQLERELLAEYEQFVDSLIAHIENTPDLDLNWLTRAATAAALPDLVRGFDTIKLRTAKEYREELAKQRQELF
ncbi:indolepyruvate ferredoxin oxidoreductase family protein [Corynebacterium sp. H78]|uniref:indolepyruvate ferredoxin oxidoreductase family protein n=1 Tax=Corynebacterium sp. H78 TaxID=3133417 RepID=UPI0030AD7E4C